MWTVSGLAGSGAGGKAIDKARFVSQHSPEFGRRDEEEAERRRSQVEFEKEKGSAWGGSREGTGGVAGHQSGCVFSGVVQVIQAIARIISYFARNRQKCLFFLHFYETI